MTDHDPDAAATSIAAEFARFRQATGAVPPAGAEAVFATARTRTRRRHTATAVAAAVAVGAVLTAGTAVTRGWAESGPDPETVPPAAAPAGLDGVPMPQPTGLQILVQDWLLDIDADRSHPVDVTGWLPRPGIDPLLAEWDWDEHASATVWSTIRPEPALPPGARQVARINRPPHGTVAAADRGGYWVLEGVGAERIVNGEPGSDECLLHKRKPAGVEPAAMVDCDLRLIAGTPHGLWAGESGGAGDTVLLGDSDLAERARFGEAVPLDYDRVLVTEDNWQTMAIHDMATGSVLPVDRPPAHGRPVPRVGPVSPDLHWLPFTFVDLSESPQLLDVWVLDLETQEWLRLPTMPVAAAVKHTQLAWAGDGRLVMLGTFPDAGRLVTWRPGHAELAVMPYERPEPEPGEPVSFEILVLEP